MLLMLERMSHDLVLPDTVYSCFQMSPVPPAFDVMAMTVPTDAIITTTDLNTKNHFSLCGGVRRKGNWIDQKIKCETICWLVMPTDAGIVLGISRYDGQIALIHWVIAVEPV